MIGNNHEWRLVAPWYHWKRQQSAEGRKPWQTRPVLQKFDHTDFVKTFTQDPQRSLRFLDLEDTVFNTARKVSPPVSGGPLAGRFTQLYAPRTRSIQSETPTPPANSQTVSLAPTGVRKLYLPTHKRFYLVVCELHCYAAGFPTVTTDQICQAGFVMRRRSIRIQPEKAKEARKAVDDIMRELDLNEAEIAFWEQTVPATGRKLKQRTKAVQQAKTNGSYDAKLAALKSKRATHVQNLGAWRSNFGVTSVLEGWIPSFVEFKNGTQVTKSPIEHIGSWEHVEETPQAGKGEAFPRGETIFPLFALFPDPNVPNHSAKGRNIYFGVIPTSSLDTDRFGTACFDSDATYEIRCFVRRHKVECPRTDKTPDCHGPLVWSESTDPFRIASATDLIGTSNRPITIKMPDLSELAAQAAALPASKMAPVRVIKPQSMNFKVDQDGKPTAGGVGGFQICFFSIPLITIVAMFLLQLFLPIVVLLFGLFFLLQLKFCIPPSLSAGAGLSASLDVLMPKLELDASIDVDVEFSASLGMPVTAGQLNTQFQDGIKLEHGFDDPDSQLNGFGNAALLPVGEGMHDAQLQTAADGRPKAEVGLDLTAAIDYEPHLEVSVS